MSGAASASATRTTTNGRSPEMPYIHDASRPSVFSGAISQADAGVGAEDARRQTIEQDGVIDGTSKMLQRRVHVGEGHRERARRCAAVAILAGQG